VGLGTILFGHQADQVVPVDYPPTVEVVPGIREDPARRIWIGHDQFMDAPGILVPSGREPEPGPICGDSQHEGGIPLQVESHPDHSPVHPSPGEGHQSLLGSLDVEACPQGS
jgi:hypothetical protein